MHIEGDKLETIDSSNARNRIRKDWFDCACPEPKTRNCTCPFFFRFADRRSGILAAALVLERKDNTQFALLLGSRIGDGPENRLAAEIISEWKQQPFEELRKSFRPQSQTTTSQAGYTISVSSEREDVRIRVDVKFKVVAEHLVAEVIINEKRGKAPQGSKPLAWIGKMLD